MKKYDSYKDSEIEWIGEIPSHWKKIKFSYITNLMTCGHASTPEYVEEGGIPFLSAQNIKNEKLDLTVLKQVPISLHESLIKNKKVEKGDLLQVRVGGADTIGQTAIVDLDFDFSIYVSLAHIKLNELAFNGYVKHLCNSLEFKEFCGVLMKKGAGVANLNVSDVASMLIPLPSLNEQISIANYLDQKTTQIDDLIAKKERLIQLLEEERTAIINQAVTKGLDPTVPMKDSDIEWLGEIPAHWFLVPVKRVIEVRDGTHDTPEYVQNELISYPLITSKDFDGEEINFSNAKMISESDHKAISKRSGVKSGDVLMSMIGGNIGKSLIIGNRDNFSIKNVALFMTRDNIFLAKYLRYYFDSGLLSKQIELKSRGGAQGFLSLGDIRNLIFFKFDFEELKTIIDYLDKKTTEISNVISKTQQEIELLKEYKTALISEVVTGKVDVRNEKLN